jgi:hypothetical protein
VTELRQDWFDELAEILRIPSISADPARSKDVRAIASAAITSRPN